jgi:hypothetical protein
MLLTEKAAAVVETAEVDITDGQGGGSGRDGVDSIAEGTLVCK